MKVGWIVFLTLTLSTGCGAEPGPGRSEHAACTEERLRPVVFVHGSELDSTTWYPMRDAFRNAGYTDASLLLMDLNPNNGDNIAAAEDQIANAVDLLWARWQESTSVPGCHVAPSFKIDLVTHSMGAISGRWYAARIAPHRVHTFVSIAGANHGTNALCGMPGTGNRQMCPAFADDKRRAHVQTALNGTRSHPVDETPFGDGIDSGHVDGVRPDDARRIRYFTIRIEPDEWIQPADSALLDGASRGTSAAIWREGFHEAPEGNFLLIADETHDDLPRNDAVIGLVLDLLSGKQTLNVE